MPNRIIREGWIESEAIDKLDAAAERFFLRLCLRADDYGRYHANPILLRSNLFPLRDDVRSTDSPRWLAACESAGLVRCYSVSGKRYIEILNFRQRLRVPVSKFPAPPDNVGPTSDTGQTHDSEPRPELEAEGEVEGEGNIYSSAAPPRPPPESIYDAYPRKQAKADALKAIAKAIKAGAAPERLLERTQAYAAAVSRWSEADRAFVPYPATWFNRGSYDDDPKTWERTGGNGVTLDPYVQSLWDGKNDHANRIAS